MTHTNREKIEGVREGEVEKFLLGKMPAFHKGKLDPDTMKFVIQIASKTLPSYIQEEVDKARNDLIDELLGGLPKKVKLDTSVYQNTGDGYAEQRIGYKQGFNDCLTDTKSLIEQKRGSDGRN